MNTQTWKFVQEVQSKRVGKISDVSKKRKSARKTPTPTTSRTFGRQLQNAMLQFVTVVEAGTSKGGVNTRTTKEKFRSPDGGTTAKSKKKSQTPQVPTTKSPKKLVTPFEGLEVVSSKERDDTFGQFDRMYRPYVFGLLEKKYFFKKVKGDRGDWTLRNGSIEADEIYNDVVAVLLGGALWRFDFDDTRVGKGAFRRYLSQIVRSVFYDRVKPDLVPVVDEDGNPVYTDEFEKDAKGRIKKDKNGNRIRKQKMISRLVFEREQFELAHDKGLPKLFASRKESGRLFTYIYHLALVAYLCTIGEKREKGRAGWQVGAMRAVFEGLEDGATVIGRLMVSGDIKDRRAFDTAKSYFLANWMACWERLCDPIIVKERIKRNGAFVRHLKTTDDDALRYIAGQEEKVKIKYGKALVAEVKRNFSNVMWMLVQKEDERESKKNAKFYK